jgi:hypothetical protein
VSTATLSSARARSSAEYGSNTGPMVTINDTVKNRLF